MDVLEAMEGIRRGTFVAHSGGYDYHLNRILAGGRASLRCRSYRRRGCRARASCAQDGTDFQVSELLIHNHPPDARSLHKRRFRAEVLRQCRMEGNVGMSLHTLYHKARREMRFDEEVARLPFRRLRRAMVRARGEALPPVPHSLAELDAILQDPNYAFLTRTLDGQDAIYLGTFGSSDDGTCVVIFASRRALRYMGNCKSVMSDNTFSSVPASVQHDCAQVWNIICLRRHHVIPLVRVLMQTKSQACYIEALDAIHLANPNFRPRRIHCDFELAQKNAWSLFFPTARIVGCLFHSSMAIASHAKEIGLTVLLRDNETADCIVRSLCALALLHQDLILDGLKSVARRCINEGY